VTFHRSPNGAATSKFNTSHAGSGELAAVAWDIALSVRWQHCSERRLKTLGIQGSPFEPCREWRRQTQKEKEMESGASRRRHNGFRKLMRSHISGEVILGQNFALESEKLKRWKVG